MNPFSQQSFFDRQAKCFKPVRRLERDQTEPSNRTRFLDVAHSHLFVFYKISEDFVASQNKVYVGIVTSKSSGPLMIRVVDKRRTTETESKFPFDIAQETERSLYKLTV